MTNTHERVFKSLLMFIVPSFEKSDAKIVLNVLVK